MARTTKPSPARNLGRRIATVAMFMVAPLPMWPAIGINLDQAADKGHAWVALGVVCVVLGAVFLELAFIAPGRGKRIVFGISACCVMMFNLQNALTNATHASDHRRDVRRAEISASERRSATISRLSQRREAQVQLAGERSAEAIEADIQAKIASDSRRWHATHQCNPNEITAKLSQEFCAEVAKLKAALAAAKERDEIDRQLEALRQEAEAAGETPTSVNPYVDNVAVFLTMLGVNVTEEARKLIAASQSWWPAFMAELAAAVGPVGFITLGLMIHGWGRKPDPVPVDSPKPASPVKREPSPAPAEPIPPLPQPSGDPIHAFIAARLERCEGSIMSAGEMWALWMAFCAETGTEIGTQKRFTLALKQWFAHDRNSNRPRWLNVKAKSAEARPALRVVASSSEHKALGKMARQSVGQ